MRGTFGTQVTHTSPVRIVLTCVHGTRPGTIRGSKPSVRVQFGGGKLTFTAKKSSTYPHPPPFQHPVSAQVQQLHAARGERSVDHGRLEPDLDQRSGAVPMLVRDVLLPRRRHGSLASLHFVGKRRRTGFMNPPCIAGSFPPERRYRRRDLQSQHRAAHGIYRVPRERNALCSVTPHHSLAPPKNASIRRR